MIKTSLGVLQRANTPAVPGTPSPLGSLMMIQLPVSTAWKRLALFDAIETELSRFNKLQTEIISRYGKNEQGQITSIEPSHPHYSQAVKEIAELSSIEVELDFDPIKLSDLENGSLSLHDLRILKLFLIVS